MTVPVDDPDMKRLLLGLRDHERAEDARLAAAIESATGAEADIERFVEPVPDGDATRSVQFVRIELPARAVERLIALLERAD